MIRMRRFGLVSMLCLTAMATAMLVASVAAQEPAAGSGPAAGAPSAPAAGTLSGDSAPPPILAARPIVRGTVTDETGPVSGATVIIEVTNMANRRVIHTTRARTDLRGVYEADLSNVKASTLGIQVNAVDENHAEATKIDVTEKSAMPIDISLELRPGRAVSGHVYDDAGNPLIGAQVEVPYVRPAKSEFDGFYTILGVPTHRQFSIMARAEGFSPQTLPVETDSSTGAITGIDFRLRPERIVHGRVIDPEGKPVKGADVTIYLPLQRVWRTADAEGEFEINNLPYEASQAQVLATHPDFASYEERTEIREGNTSLTIQMDYGALLEGTVASEAGGAPIVGASVALSLPDALPRVVDQTDADGRFRAKNLPEGDVVITVYPPGDASMERGGEWLVEQTGTRLKGDVNPWPDQTASDFEGTVEKGVITLKRRDRGGDAPSDPKATAVATYRGTLSEDGLKIEGTFVFGSTERKGTWEAVRSGGKPDRLTGLWTWKEQLTTSKTKIAPVHMRVTVEKGKTTTEALVLPQGWTLNGVVRDGENNPVPGAQVRVFRWDDLPADLSPATSDMEGKFTLDSLPKGTIDVWARKPEVGSVVQTFAQPRAADSPADFVLAINVAGAGGVPGQPRKDEDLFAGSPKVGEKAPEFTATALDGSTVDLAKLQGKVVLLDFWASWCGPCIAEMPTFVEIQKKYGSRDDFILIGVSLDFTEEDVKKAIEKHGIQWVQLFDGKGWEAEVGLKYGVMSIPRTFVIDKKGNVAADGLRGEAIRKAVEDALDIGE